MKSTIINVAGSGNMQDMKTDSFMLKYIYLHIKLLSLKLFHRKSTKNVYSL